MDRCRTAFSRAGDLPKCLPGMSRRLPARYAVEECFVDRRACGSRLSFAGAVLTAGLLGAFACTPGPNPDVDRDGVVGPLDLARVEACVGTNRAADPGCATSDVDLDGDVDAADLALVGAQLDSDGDGIRDEVELVWGLDPQNPTDALVDDDGDGLSIRLEIALGTSPYDRDTDRDDLQDGAELTVGTNPVDPDTDGGGRRDGWEVWRDRTDPTHADDDHEILTLPYDFFDGSGRRWTVDQLGRVSTDGWSKIGGPGLLLELNGHATKAPGKNRIVVSGAVRHLEIEYPESLPGVRMLDVGWSSFDPTWSFPSGIEARPAAGNPAGFVATSSGDLAFDPSDDWVVVDDADASGLPAAVWVLAGDTSFVPEKVWGDSLGSYLYTQYTLRPPAKGFSIAMSFWAQADTRAEAVALASALRDLELGALDDLDPQARAAIANFTLPAP